MRKLCRFLKKKFHLEHWRIIAAFMMLYDAAAVLFSYFFTLWIRFDCRFSYIPADCLEAFCRFAPIYAAGCLVIFWCFRLYLSIWEYASVPELLRIAGAWAVSIVFHVVGITVLFMRMPLFYYIGGAILELLLITAIRFSYRFILLIRSRRARSDGARSRVMIVGAGSAGQFILHDIARSSKMGDRVLCIIDDNPNKWGRYLDGVPIVGGREDILSNVERFHIEKIYVAIPSADPKELRDVLNICKESGCELRNLPGMYQFMSGAVRVSALREVAIEDLLGRDPIHVETQEIYAFLEGRVILVTGGGGSIGSELCRQIAGHAPKKLIIFDIYENNAYEIEQELKRERLNLDFVVEIGSVRDTRRVNQIFEKYHPDIVFHAAAHKHVPLMEGSPCEAIKNNVLGTYKTAYAAMTHGCRRFVLVSTDKAVNPTNIMGASKRMCEMIIQAFDRKLREHREAELPELRSHGEDYLSRHLESVLPLDDDAVRTEFVAVRFGNVLGSNGSVIPLFKKMIARGGPVEVTHKDIIRYFMTIPEAVSLILQAGTYAHGGEIFVLDMGEPMKIDTLARNLIKLSGLRPDEDIKIVYTGLRPGEKLYEEKLMAEEGLSTTPNKLIHIGKPIGFDEDEFLNRLPALMDAAYANDESIRTMVKEMVSTYHPAGERETVAAN